MQLSLLEAHVSQHVHIMLERPAHKKSCTPQSSHAASAILCRSALRLLLSRRCSLKLCSAACSRSARSLPPLCVPAQSCALQTKLFRSLLAFWYTKMRSLGVARESGYRGVHRTNVSEARGAQGSVTVPRWTLFGMRIPQAGTARTLSLRSGVPRAAPISTQQLLLYVYGLAVSRVMNPALPLKQ